MVPLFAKNRICFISAIIANVLKNGMMTHHNSGKENASKETEFPTTLTGFKYAFNQDGQLRHVETGQPFVFSAKPDDSSYNQRRYEALGEVITTEIYDLLEKRCGLVRLKIPVTGNTPDDEFEPATFIFTSPDFQNQQKVMIFIHGSGVVRAGQWSRKLIINDCLNSGSQIPFIEKAKSLGYGVVVLNTNDNRKKIGIIEKFIKGSSSPEEHLTYVYDNFIAPANSIKHVAIVAHSFGGIATIYLLSQRKNCLEKVFSVALTDSVHNCLHQGIDEEVKDFMKKNVRNWVASDLSLDKPIPDKAQFQCQLVSAGHTVHENTSWSAFNSIFKWIDEKYRIRVKSEL